MAILERVNRYFDFSTAQLRVLALLVMTAVVMSAYLLVRSATTPTIETPALPVIIGDEEKYVGIFVLDPNTAPVDSLELLPGIGKILADRIIEYRQSKPFRREIDVTEVKGIGPKLYERLKPYLKIKP